MSSVYAQQRAEEHKRTWEHYPISGRAPKRPRKQQKQKQRGSLSKRTIRHKSSIVAGFTGPKKEKIEKLVCIHTDELWPDG